ncbi:DUF3085 domain-containing protein [Nocardia abscessus]|uniref:DUF3085 domain-containing protein n=1 Tax=Nocardia abscessus TaxID=120957 RepID=UPI00189530EF|nr:DUF3085 domain-containing protein [Nocardia abscessus]MBF6341302.1 DUF3085 domain-containing protein [Nocardia abscessus]
MTSVTLWFPLPKVLDLAEHAMAAPGHSRSPYDDPGPAVPSLIWVKDQGIYLMSNGLPRQPGEPGTQEGRARVVYALDHGPGTHWIHGEPLGDDFAEYLDLSQNYDGHTLIELIRTSAAVNDWFCITVSPRSFEMMFSPTAPAPNPLSGGDHRRSHDLR